MAEQAGSRDVSILLTGFDHEIPIRGDDRMVRQILANLLTNAVEFSEAGGSVSVEAAWRDGELAVSVPDPGLGMDARVIEIRSAERCVGKECVSQCRFRWVQN